VLEYKDLPQNLCNGIYTDELTALYKQDALLTLELLSAQGLQMVKKDALYLPANCLESISQSRFCIVDIETNGSKTSTHQIIEIGAVRVEGLKVVDRYESFVKCSKISPHITQITGISTDDTENAPSMQDVMSEFRLFLGSDLFVGHDVKFDYSFISAMMLRSSLPPLLNLRLCTIALAERTISSYRYGLLYLNQSLNLHQDAIHHRALSDALTTAELFKKIVQNLPQDIYSVAELLEFSASASRLKRPKFAHLEEDSQ